MDNEMSKIYLPDSFSFTICRFFHNAMRQMATIRTTTTTPTIPLRAEAMRTIGTSVVGLMAVASVKSVDRAAGEIQKKNFKITYSTLLDGCSETYTPNVLHIQL